MTDGQVAIVVTVDMVSEIGNLNDIYDYWSGCFSYSRYGEWNKRQNMIFFTITTSFSLHLIFFLLNMVNALKPRWEKN